MTANAQRAATRASDWRLTLPARTPYDRQLLLQCLRRTVTHWGTVRVVIGARLLLVVGDSGAAAACTCGRPAGGVRCQVDGRETCLGCALDAATAEQADQATVGIGAMAPAAPTQRASHGGGHSTRAAASRPSPPQRRQ